MNGRFGKQFAKIGYGYMGGAAWVNGIRAAIPRRPLEVAPMLTEYLRLLRLRDWIGRNPSIE